MSLDFVVRHHLKTANYVYGFAATSVLPHLVRVKTQFQIYFEHFDGIHSQYFASIFMYVHFENGKLCSAMI